MFGSKPELRKNHGVLLKEEEKKKLRGLFVKDLDVFQGYDELGIWLRPMKTLDLETTHTLSTSPYRAIQFVKSQQS